jgi:UDP-3-O-[3-hydroxymyristoyl] glucosamine N-acyltransferase
MEFTAQQIAQLLGGTIEGNPEVCVNKVSKIEEGVKGSISFLANPQYTSFIYDTDASIVIVAESFEAEKALKNTCTLIRVEKPYESFAKLLDFYNQFRHAKSGIESTAIIHPSATIGKNCYIGHHCVISENSKIEDDVKIYPHTFLGNNVSIGKATIINSGVKIYHDSKIGQNVVIHSGCVIGGDGFGFAPNAENHYNKVAQIGNVVIEDHVEIGSNTTIDRATMGSTIIKKGVKLDNLIQIAHNVEIGENTVIASQTGIAGSTKIGKNCMIGGQVGIVGHIKIGDNVKIAAQSGIGHSLEDGSIVQGSPAFSFSDYKRAYVLFKKLPELYKRIDELEKQLKTK